MKPVIGITTNTNTDGYSINKAYCNAVTAAGGVPLLVPVCDNNAVNTILSRLDGVILSGGGDIAAEFFNHAPHPKADGIDKTRDTFEIEICKAAMHIDMPVLGVCRGVQVLNVACGGSLNQHVDGHDHNDKRNQTVHDVNITTGTKLYDIVSKTPLAVNSVHHQVIDCLGGGLVACAISAADGLVEAVEARENTFILGVQWHPEALFENHPEHLEIFKAFADYCKKGDYLL